MPRNGRARWAAIAIAATVLSGAATLSALGSLGEAGQSASQRTSIALLNLDALWNGLDEMAARQKIFAEKIRPWEDELQSMVDEMKRIDDDLKTLNLSEDEKVEMRVRLTELSESHKLKTQLRGQVAAVEEGRILREVYNKALGAVERVAEENGYDLVLLDDRSLPLPDGPRATSREVQTMMLTRQVLYANEQATDITDRVIARMNNDYAAGK